MRNRESESFEIKNETNREENEINREKTTSNKKFEECGDKELKIDNKEEELQLQKTREKLKTAYGEKKEIRGNFQEFNQYFIGPNKIELPPNEKRTTHKMVSDFQKENLFILPKIFKGNKTATKYDSKVTNFSTKTAIKELPGGQKVFVVDSYPLSFIHRAGDAVLRRIIGIKDYKVPNRRWKETFEKRSEIPTINIDNKRAVVMPYIPNINLGDLMAHKIRDVGEVKWAAQINLQKKLEIIKKTAQAIENIHQKGKTWGEAILGNMIIDKNEKIWICDPETLFYKNVPLIEQKASDLLDVVFTSAAALDYSENYKNYTQIIEKVFSNYSDKEVIKNAIQKARKNPSFLQRLFFSSIKTRYYPIKNFKMYEEIRNSIASYKLENKEK